MKAMIIPRNKHHHLLLVASNFPPKVNFCGATIRVVLIACRYHPWYFMQYGLELSHIGGVLTFRLSLPCSPSDMRFRQIHNRNLCSNHPYLIT